MSVKEYLADNFLDPASAVHSAAAHPLSGAATGHRLLALGRAGSVMVSSGPASPAPSSRSASV